MMQQPEPADTIGLLEIRGRWQSLFASLGLAFLGVTLAGCALDGTQGVGATGEGSGPGASDGAVASKSEAVAGLIVGPFVWNQGDPQMAVRASADFVCVLTRVSGRFGGGGEKAALTNDGNFWWLGGHSLQTGVSAEAYCFARGFFLANGDDGGPSLQFSGSGVGTDAGRCFGDIVNTFWGDAATAINGINGAMNGDRESVHVTQSLDAFTSSTLSTGSCSVAELVSTANSFWFGTQSSGKLATFAGPTGDRGTADQIPEVVVGGNTGAAVLAPVGQSVCYFTTIQGGFFGAGEWAQIRSELIGATSYWMLRTGQGAASNFVRAGARCYARDQR